ncbi:MAG: RNA polymerase sigma factor, partial [Longimicrobiales bacterium]
MTATDLELVGRARNGDSAAFGSLVRRHYDAAFAVALARVGSREDAEDACQDAFITALQRLDECRQPERFRAWVLQIVRNRAHNVRRHQSLRSGPPLDRAGLLHDPGQNPARDAERAELRGRLSEAMRTLTPTQREVLLLHDAEGLRHREIASALGISQASSRVHLHKARR